MLEKIVKDAGFHLVRTEDHNCLLQCVENLQRERDKYRDSLKSLLTHEEMAEEHF